MNETYIKPKIYREDQVAQISYYNWKKQAQYSTLENPYFMPPEPPQKMQFRPCENFRNFIAKNKIKYISDGIRYQGSKGDAEEKICSVHAMYSGVHILQFRVQVPVDLIRKQEDHHKSKPPINNRFLRLPTFKVGLVVDGEEDNDVWKEQWCYKRLFGNLGEENRGIISFIDNQWEYKSNFQDELVVGSFNTIQIELDLNEGTFRIRPPTGDNQYTLMKNFLDLKNKQKKNRGWRFYFGWSFCDSKIEIIDYTYQP